MQIPKIDYTMQAQALFDFRTLSLKRRTYKVDINDRLILEDLPEEVLVAWFAHELDSCLGLPIAFRFGITEIRYLQRIYVSIEEVDLIVAANEVQKRTP